MDKLTTQKKIFSDLRKFARGSRLNKLKEAHGPKPMHTGATQVHITIGSKPTNLPNVFDDMQDEEMEALAPKKKRKDGAEEDAEEG